MYKIFPCTILFLIYANEGGFGVGLVLIINRFFASLFLFLQVLQRAFVVPPSHVLDRLGAMGALHGSVWRRDPGTAQDL